MEHEQQTPNDLFDTIRHAQQNFLKHAALELHYERLKMANAHDHQQYYRYAELQYFHKSKALHFKSQFSAASFM
ncbi:hypothetical protein [Domibacillus robiginosus]|uniref:hypothetical protein n=1 Tax=Domibacillus robiginosus TaxID=1071054 RepID=UPI00067BC2F4|nr:hypothetical protein [Domibacillus robiginosus]